MEAVFAALDTEWMNELFSYFGLFPAGILLGVFAWGFSYLLYSIFGFFKV